MMTSTNVVYIYSGKLLSHKKEWNFVICYDMDEPWKQFAKWNSQDIKGQILYDSTCMKYLEQADS